MSQRFEIFGTVIEILINVSFGKNCKIYLEMPGYRAFFLSRFQVRLFPKSVYFKTTDKKYRFLSRLLYVFTKFVNPETFPNRGLIRHVTTNLNHTLSDNFELINFEF